MKRFLKVAFALVVTLSFLAACSSSKNGLDGTWEGKENNEKVELKISNTKANLKMAQGSESGSLAGKVDKDKEKITFDIAGEKLELNYTLDGDTLTVDFEGLATDLKRK